MHIVVNGTPSNPVNLHGISTGNTVEIDKEITIRYIDHNDGEEYATVEVEGMEGRFIVKIYELKTIRMAYGEYHMPGFNTVMSLAHDYQGSMNIAADRGEEYARTLATTTNKVVVLEPPAMRSSRFGWVVSPTRVYCPDGRELHFTEKGDFMV